MNRYPPCWRKERETDRETQNQREDNRGRESETNLMLCFAGKYGRRSTIIFHRIELTHGSLVLIVLSNLLAQQVVILQRV